MNKAYNKGRAFIIAIFAVLAVLAIAPHASLADDMYSPYERKASSLKNGETITIYMEAKQSISMSTTLSFSAKKGQIKNVKSSNTKVAKASVSPHNDSYALVINSIKPGKTKVTYTYRGEKRSINVVVKKYVNAFKTIKVGKTSIKKLFDDTSTPMETPVRNGRGKKLTVASASGWKVVKIQAIFNGVNNFKSIKNGSKIPKKAIGFFVTLRNTKTKGSLWYTVTVS